MTKNLIATVLLVGAFAAMGQLPTRPARLPLREDLPTPPSAHLSQPKACETFQRMFYQDLPEWMGLAGGQTPSTGLRNALYTDMRAAYERCYGKTPTTPKRSSQRPSNINK